MSDDYAEPVDDTCSRCSCCYRERVECWACGGEGATEPGALYEEDPLWYDPDDTMQCGTCAGAGGWWRCGGDCDKSGWHRPASTPRDPYFQVEEWP